MDRLVKEATEIHFTTNLDKNTGFILSQAWYSVTNMLYNQKDRPERVSTWLRQPAPLTSMQACPMDSGRYIYGTIWFPATSVSSEWGQWWSWKCLFFFSPFNHLMQLVAHESFIISIKNTAILLD
jgi:hypothetical protein